MKQQSSGGVTRGIKLVVIGSNVPERGNSGDIKTILLVTYANNRYPETYLDQGAFDNYVVNLVAGQDTIELGLWEVRDSEYDRLRPLAYANANVFLVVFSVTNPASYEEISSKWIPELIYFCPNVPSIVVGCQTELRSDEKTLDRLRKQGQQPITYEQGRNLAAKTRAVRYMECSARTGEGVKQVFDEAVKAVLFNRPPSFLSNAMKGLSEMGSQVGSLIQSLTTSISVPASENINQNQSSSSSSKSFSTQSSVLEQSLIVQPIRRSLGYKSQQQKMSSAETEKEVQPQRIESYGQIEALLSHQRIEIEPHDKDEPLKPHSKSDIKEQRKNSLLSEIRPPIQAFQKKTLSADIMPLEDEFQNTSVVLSHSEIDIGNLLGAGRYGVVYEGTWNYGAVAVKRLHKKDLDKDAKLEFEHEASVMLELRHPNILVLYGITLEPEYCMVMEFMEGGSLYAALQGAEILKWPLRYKIAMDAAKGLAYLHGRAQPILHRDLKSLNILLDGLYRAKLADFGLSRVKRLNDHPTVVDTLAWIAPELLLNPDKAEFTTVCDIYSLGVVFWELITRQVPYSAAYKEQRENIPPETPSVFAELTRRCWAENPSDRPTAQEVCEFLVKQPISSNDKTASSSSSSLLMAEKKASILPIDTENSQQINHGTSVGITATSPRFFSGREGSSTQKTSQSTVLPLPKPSGAISTNQSQQSNGASFGNFQFSGMSAGNKRKSIEEFQFSGVYSQGIQSTSALTDSATEGAKDISSKLSYGPV